MRLVFTNADQDTFDEYRALFIPRVLDYGRKRGLNVSRRALELLLDFKYGAPDKGGDGLLARWSTADVVSLLLDWLPAESGRSAVRTAEVRTALDSWLGFLNEEDLLDRRSDAREDLLGMVDRLADAYQHAIDDPAEHRVAAYMHCVMDDLGFEIDDPEQIADFEAKVEAGAIAVDDDLVAAIAAGEEEGPKSLLAGPGRAGYTWRAPRLLEDAELDAAITAAPTIVRLRELAPEELPEDAAEAWLMAYDAVGEALAERLNLDEDGFEAYFGLASDEFTGSVLTSLFIERLALPASIVVEMVAELGDQLDDEFRMSPKQEAKFTEAVGLVLTELERLGAVEGATSGEDAELAGEPVYRLTPLGEWAGLEELTAEDYTIRDFDELMGESAEVLVERAAAGEALSETDLDSWIAERDEEAAMRELVEVARRTDDSTHRAAVRAVTAEHPSAAHPVYEALRDDHDFGHQARVWLFDAGFAKESDLEAEDLSWVMIDGIAALARMGMLGDEQIQELPVNVGNDGTSLFDLARMLRHPETGFLLTWLGENHPDPALRKEARTTLYRYQSGQDRRG
ncbi:hypothetical protein [Nocardiopsis ansamitocini]|uniref:Uncharacterized protein n=1 Tax=Nocardiopsis ansamitocini TaxID=1670832 RepID=A0A9W6UIH0_9ACTN|nr:hypothetical protein [Nocardiopsis ansamitocini]GLU47689.1 hypothetical protein Nans01_20400 [Nocardiopsis ansamitocini]